MSKKLHLSIPEPCQQSWESMTPAGGGRHCASCQKVVIDFSSMSDRQLLEYFQKPAGPVCGRFLPEQLDHTIVAPRKPVPYLRYLFQIALPAFLVSCKSGTQAGGDKTIGVLTESIQQPQQIEQTTLRTTGTPAVSHKDEPPLKHFQKTPQVVLGDTVMIDTSTAVTDTLAPSCVLDEVVVSSLVSVRMGGIGVRATKVTWTDTVVKAIDKVIDTVSNRNIRLFPNPASQGSLVKVDWNGCKEGLYQLQVINMNGQVVHQKEIEVSNKQTVFPLNLPQLVPGTYIISFTNPAVKKPYTQKLIVR